jgi:3-hydroxyacyl-CoA dehydrogenase
LVNDALAFAIKKQSQSWFMTKPLLRALPPEILTITLSWIKNADWIIEVVVERLDIKKIIFEKVEKFRKPGTLDYFKHFGYSNSFNG